MRKIYIILVVNLLTFVCYGQIVNIPDANFKSFLLSYQPLIDTNGDNQIQNSEALNVTTLNIQSYTTTNLTGIEAFTNLQSLTFNTSVTSVNLTGLVNLENLYSQGNQLVSLDVSMLSNLRILNCSTTYLTNLNVTGLTNLIDLNCFGCSNLSTLNLTGLTNLQNLNCSYCDQLTTLNLNGLVNLQNLDCSDLGGLTNLDVSSLVNLQNLNCSGNNLTSLDVSNLNALTNLHCSYNYIQTLTTTGANNITQLNCRYNALSSLTVNNMLNLQILDCESQGGGGISNLDLTGLSSLNFLSCSGNNLNTLDVTNLVNLTHLSCSDNSIGTLNLSNLNLLTHLECSLNPLTSLNVSNLINLTFLGCASNQLSTLNVTPLINLITLNCGQNNLTNLDVSSLISLSNLVCSGNQLTSLDVSNSQYISNLNCSNNQLSSIDLSNLGYLIYINVAHNLFTSIDLSNTGLITLSSPNIPSYDFNSNPNLTYINLKNGQYLNFLYGYIFFNCPNLAYICAQDQYIQYIQQQLQSENITNVQVNSYCSFVPGVLNNSITGTFTLDINNNGCDLNDFHPNDIKININDGILSGATFTNNGLYSFYNQAGNFVLTPQFQNQYFTVSPTTATLNFPSLNGSTQTQNFCITPNGIHNDLDITIIPLQPAQPGFDALYNIVFKNKGNQTLSGTINFQFNDAILDYITANPVVSSQSLNNLNWNFSNLIPFESRNIYLTLNVNGPTEIPPVNINDELVFTSTINPISGDETATDNVFNLNQIVVGSYDPNDKTCLEGTTISPTKIGDYLHYLIRFQNSGTAPATNIVVKDMIDATKFDINTLQLITTSHPQVTRITGNKVEFIFQGINLPAEQDNEPASHGFIAFKIKTKNNLVLGNSVSNTADIYFDYNFPIITNTATSTFTALGANEFENKSVSVYPNPTKNILTITAKENITFIQLFDIQGRLIETKLTTSTEAKFDISKQLAGIYFVKVYTENGVKIEKIIKQ
jgi:Leucine-rich repeat (LRR) protein